MSRGAELLLIEVKKERDDLRLALFQYGDHTIACYQAPTPKCLCGWIATRKRFGIKPREEE